MCMCVRPVHGCCKWMRKRSLLSPFLSSPSSPLLFSPSSSLPLLLLSSSHLHLPMAAVVRFLRRLKHHIPTARVVVRSAVEKDGRAIPETKRVSDVLGPAGDGGERRTERRTERGISSTLACCVYSAYDRSTTRHNTQHTPQHNI